MKILTAQVGAQSKGHPSNSQSSNAKYGALFAESQVVEEVKQRNHQFERLPGFCFFFNTTPHNQLKS